MNEYGKMKWGSFNQIEYVPILFSLSLFHLKIMALQKRIYERKLWLYLRYV